MAEKKRIAWVDCAKGIAMLLVITGHAVGKRWIVAPIYSFHVPLFFILSGYTTICTQDGKTFVRRLKKTFCQLFLLAYILFFLNLVLTSLTGKSTYTLRQNLLACFWASGDGFSLKGIWIPSFGRQWFLVTLFFLRNLYGVLYLRTKGRHMTAWSVAITALGVLIGRWVYLPLGLDQAMVSFVFFDFGQRLKSCMPKITTPRYIGLGFLWGGACWQKL